MTPSVASSAIVEGEERHWREGGSGRGGTRSVGYGGSPFDDSDDTDLERNGGLGVRARATFVGDAVPPSGTEEQSEGER